MTIARKRQIHLGSTSFYHCTVRCVRRAWLCGQDEVSGANYDHRKQWLVSRLRFLSYVYAIDLCAYAVMSNHYHVVLHVDKERALGWSQQEVVERWTQIYAGHPLVDEWLKHPNSMSTAQQDVVDELIETWRERLYGIDWFMRGVNETIARMANEEENQKGRFWEGRYKSQALLDEAVLLTCMAYVDLNPVRASMTDDLIKSDFTSIQQRLFDHAKRKQNKSKDEQALITRVKKQKQLKADLELDDQPEAELMRFKKSMKNEEPFSLQYIDMASSTRGERNNEHRNAIHDALPMTQADYFELVDTTGRCIRDDKPGYIKHNLPPILKRLNIDPEQWLEQVKHFHRYYAHCAGSPDNIVRFAKRFKRSWGKGVRIAKRMYKQAA